MKAAGYSESTVQRAAQALRVETERRGTATAGSSQTWWRISLDDASARALTPPALASSPLSQFDASAGTAQPCGAGAQVPPLASRLEEAVEAHLRDNPAASKTEVARAVDGRRSDVLRLYDVVKERLQPHLDGAHPRRHVPIPGDPDFIEFLLDVGNRGLITEREFKERAAVHALIVKHTPPPEGGGKEQP